VAIRIEARLICNQPHSFASQRREFLGFQYVDPRSCVIGRLAVITSEKGSRWRGKVPFRTTRENENSRARDEQTK
jgi:hypothetical protein